MGDSINSVKPVSVTCTKKKILVDATVEAEFSGKHSWMYSWQSVEQRAKELERKCEEFNEHVRDHRSLDHVVLTVNRVYSEVCSACDSEWETYLDENQMLSCVHCGGLAVSYSKVIQP